MRVFYVINRMAFSFSFLSNYDLFKNKMYFKNGD